MKEEEGRVGGLTLSFSCHLHASDGKKLLNRANPHLLEDETI